MDEDYIRFHMFRQNLSYRMQAFTPEMSSASIHSPVL